MKSLVVILDNIRSTYNVGAILRTCDGLGVSEVVFVGCTPFLDKGLPHEQKKLAKMIHKTALGAEKTVFWRRFDELLEAIEALRKEKYVIWAIEQDKQSQNLAKLGKIPEKVAMILGEEVHGIKRNELEASDKIIEIPMVGTKESFNVSVAAGMVLWEICRNKY